MIDFEIEITADLVHDLLQEQHPDLAGPAIREVAGGWDNQQWRLGDELAVRMPRRTCPGSPAQGVPVAACPGPAPAAPGPEPCTDR
jgi:aminoglycoside phosphotransferase (APT) family kinase protein